MVPYTVVIANLYIAQEEVLYNYVYCHLNF